jgi:serine/threonine protein kinase/Tfp pilus assembly protein PilF
MHEPTPSRPAADRNLLFGILALQMDFITQEALIQAMRAWVLEKAKPLGQILLGQGDLRPDRRDLLENLVEAHLEVHGGQPADSLAALSVRDTLRQDLEQVADSDVQASLCLVSVARRAGEDDSHPTRDPDKDYSPPPLEPSVGVPTSAGVRFRILRPHAKGGLGQVSVALDSELNREVALKEIQARYADDPESRARFLLEAEITGRLEHPGIVPVYGLGVYLDGRPFYAMRFIKGDSLQKAIQHFHAAEPPGRDPGERTLARRELLGRFVAVCQAVAYAHSRGVLHRDLKPGNVMLGKYGETLVVDWGLAKALNRPETTPAPAEPALRPHSGSALGTTRAGSVIGTPAYMSPEQAAGQLDRLGPAADVYSLGATLYCLLTGQAPFADPDVAEVLGRVQRGDFPPPRQAQPHVPAALEAVCLKAMALRPEDRYAGALELADEVERWLADEPVRSYREPYRQRAARWLRRHRTLAVGAVILLLTATAGLAGGLYFVNAEKNRTEAARQDEVAQRALAAQAAAEARMVLDFFQDRVLAAARPKDQDGGLGIQATIREAVEAAEPKIAGAFQERPLVEASIRHALGLTYKYLREDRAAITQYERALALRRDHLGPDHPDTLRVMNNLATAYKAAGRLDLALPLLERALAKCQEKLSPDHPQALTTMNNLAVVYKEAGQLDKAVPLFEQALAKCQEKLGPDHPDTLVSMHNLASAYQDAGQRTKALPLYEQALVKFQEKLGPDHPQTLTTMNNLAHAYQETGQLEQALPLLERALAKCQEKLGPDHPQTLAHMNNLAVVYKEAGQLDKAVPLVEQVLPKLQEKLGPDHPHTLTTMNNLAHAYQETGQLEQALPLYEQALARRKEKLGPDHLDTLASMNDLAQAYQKNGNFPKAELILRECLTVRQKKQPDAWTTFNTQIQLGACLLGQQKYAEAEPLLRTGYEEMKQRQGKIPAQGQARLTEALDRLVQLYDAWGKPDQAARWRAKRDQLPKAPEPPKSK